MKSLIFAFLCPALFFFNAVAEQADESSVTEWESVNKENSSKKTENTKRSAPEEKKDALPKQAPQQPPPEAQPDKSTASMTSRELRELNRHSFLVNYSFFDTWIPGKYGATYAFNASPSGSWEVEYLRGSISVPFFIEDLGKITDQRLTLMYRSFSQRNSFSFLYGANYSSFKFQLGPDYLATITGGNASTFDVVSVETLGITWGMGNRWQINKAIISFDWFVINIPVVVLESEAPFLEATASESSKEDIRDVLDIIEKFPTLAILKFQLGFSF